MTGEEHELTRGPATDAAARDTASQRALFSYLTADVADEYLAIMRLFTGTLLADRWPRHEPARHRYRVAGG